jgi:hypothetical protein
MKARLTVEIEYPDGYDAQWDVDPSGRQAFHDVVICGMQEAALELVFKAGVLRRVGSESDKEYSKYLLTQANILRSIKVVE